MSTGHHTARWATMEPMTTPDDGPPPNAVRRSWPVTLGLVALAVLLVVVDLFGASIATAPFFGDIPSRSQYLEAGAIAISAVVPLAVLALAGWLLGSRIGLGGIVASAIVSAVAGASLLSHTGDPSDPDPTRALRLRDVVSDLNVLNGIALVLALVLLVVARFVRRRRRAGEAAP